METHRTRQIIHARWSARGLSRRARNEPGLVNEAETVWRSMKFAPGAAPLMGAVLPYRPYENHEEPVKKLELQVFF